MTVGICIGGILRGFGSVIGFLLQGRMRTRAGSCYASPAVGDSRENCKRKRQMMSREEMNGKRRRREPTGVNHFDDLPDDVLISVLAQFSTTAKYAAEFVNVILTCKRFNTLGLHLLVLPQEKVYRRLQNLKEMHYPEIKEFYTKVSMKCQQPMAPDTSEKLKYYKTTLQRMMAYFQVQKSSIPPGFKEDKVDAFEKQIQAILNSFKHIQSALKQQQKVYQRLQNMKEMYYPEIKELFTKLSIKYQQPMAPDQFEKLKHYKTTLQRVMAYLKVQKSSIPPGFKEDKVDAFERQIQAILDSFKKRHSASQQQRGQ